MKAFDSASMVDSIGGHLAPETEVCTDALPYFRRLEDADHTHTVLETDGRRATGVSGARWVKVILANLMRAISRQQPRHQASQVRAALLDRSEPPIQLATPLERNAAATGHRHAVLQALCGDCAANGENFHG